jgi:hypothetical protein
MLAYLSIWIVAALKLNTFGMGIKCITLRSPGPYTIGNIKEFLTITPVSSKVVFFTFFPHHTVAPL